MITPRASCARHHRNEAQRMRFVFESRMPRRREGLSGFVIPC